jgi:RNA polymerase sigma factor (sigma-70 family)
LRGCLRRRVAASSRRARPACRPCLPGPPGTLRVRDGPTADHQPARGAGFRLDRRTRHHSRLTRMVTTDASSPIRVALGVVPYGVRRIGAPVEQLSDEALLAGFGAGDPEIAAAFVKRFQAKVYGVAVHIVRDARTAEDVAQSVFERAWRHARNYDPRRASVSGWLGVIARNLAIDTVRVRPVLTVDPASLVAEFVGDGQGARGPEQAAVDSEAAAELQDAIRRLSPEQARAVVLSGIRGFSASQVAESEGIPLGTAKTRIRTGLLKLRSALQDVRSEHE